MNIFVSDECPTKSAEFLDTKRVNKMILESAQMLSTAVYLNMYSEKYTKECLRRIDVKELYKAETNLYLPTHNNHPCTKWAAKNRSNYLWLVDHFFALLSVYEERRGRVHKCKEMLFLLEHYAEFMPVGDRTPFVNCAANESLGLNFKDISDVHEAYRQYLKNRWKYDKIEPTWE